ncbi:MAG: glycosyltransferase [Dysgonamonadaceae bacterium]|jgi:hypothetical protein|nr:glycosyltransferase [Dysgonamonadaceae bacterium]
MNYVKKISLSSPGIRISYGITVYNEHKELEQLLKIIIQFIDPEDEIIILSDWEKITKEVLQIINKYNKIIKHISYPLNNDFGNFKNNFLKCALGDYLFQIDADEIPNEKLLQRIKRILYLYEDVDCVMIPRINFIEEMSEDYIQKWNWSIDEKKRINYPDLQMRLFKINKEIKWKGNVHETLINCTNHVILPYADTENYCLYHLKTFKKQQKQNNYYNSIF